MSVRCPCEPGDDSSSMKGEPVVSVQVKPGSDIDELRRRIPPHVDVPDGGEPARVAVEIRVVEVPELHAGCEALGGRRMRPAPGGCSVGKESSGQVSFGTLGGWVWDRDGKQPVLLTNQHVIGNPGDQVYQPGGEGAGNGDIVAQVIRSTASPDQAIAEPVVSDLVSEEIECLGPAVCETAEAACCMPVQKVGARTGLTCGVVTELCYESVVLDRGSGSDIKVEPPAGLTWTEKGDSGSLYCVEGSDPPQVIGLHWGGIQAGNKPYGLAIPIQTVFADLDLAVLPARVQKKRLPRAE